MQSLRLPSALCELCAVIADVFRLERVTEYVSRCLAALPLNERVCVPISACKSCCSAKALSLLRPTS